MLWAVETNGNNEIKTGKPRLPGAPDLSPGKSRPESPAPRVSRLRLQPAFALLALVVFVGLGIRIYVALSAAMVSRDSTTFIWYAQELARHPIEEMRKQAQHPLYPAMVLGAHEIIHTAGGLLRPVSPAVDRVLDDPVQSWTLAGRLVTLLAGAGVILAVYWLGSLLFGRPVGLIAAILAAFTAEFCQLSGDVLSDMPHLTLYLCGLCAAIRGIRANAGMAGSNLPGAGPPEPCHDPLPPMTQRPIGWLFLAGVLSGLAFLVRPEGGEVGVVAVAGVCVLARRWSIRRQMLAVLAVMMGMGLVASPYMVVTGKLVQKKSIKRFIADACEEGPEAKTFDRHTDGGAYPRSASLPSGIPPADSAASSEPGKPSNVGPVAAGALPIDVGRALGRVMEDWWRSLRVTLMLPAVVWFLAWIAQRRAANRASAPPRPKGWATRFIPPEPTAARLVLAAGSLHLLIALNLIVRFDYWELFSVRHVMILAGLTLPFSAAGLVLVMGMIPPARRTLAGIMLLAGLVTPTLPWMLERRLADEVYLRRAGEWIRTQQPAGAKVQTTRYQVAFYANGTWQWSPPDSDFKRAPAEAFERVLVEARTWKPDWVVFDEQRMLKRSPNFFDHLQRALLPKERLELHKDEKQYAHGLPQRALIYRYGPAS